MDQSQWVVFFEQNENIHDLVPPLSEARITEEGQARFTEDSQLRVTE